MRLQEENQRLVKITKLEETLKFSSMSIGK